MPVTAECRYGKCRVRVSGDVNIYTAAQLKAGLGEQLGCGEELELVLSEVEEFDSAGVQLLLWLWREAEQGKKSIRLLEPSGTVVELLALYGLTGEFAAGDKAPAQA